MSGPMKRVAESNVGSDKYDLEVGLINQLKS